jgi:hypothetical protein
MFLFQNTSVPVQTTLPAAAHVAEGQFLPEEQTLNMERMNQAGNRKPTVSKTEGR